MKSTGLVFAEKLSIGVEPTRLYDRSRYGSNGTHSNITMVQLPSGLWVLSFNGTTAYVAFTKPIIPAGSFTVSVWQKNAETIAVLRCVWEKYEGNNEDFCLMYCAHGAPWASAYDGGVQHRIDALPNSDTTWHKVTWTNDAGTNTIYVDGTLSQTRVISAGPAYGSPTDTFSWSFTGVANRLFTVGRGRGDARYYKGDEALPEVHNYALSAGQIKKIFGAERHWFGV